MKSNSKLLGIWLAGAIVILALGLSFRACGNNGQPIPIHHVAAPSPSQTVTRFKPVLKPLFKESNPTLETPSPTPLPPFTFYPLSYGGSRLRLAWTPAVDHASYRFFRQNDREGELSCQIPRTAEAINFYVVKNPVKPTNCADLKNTYRITQGERYRFWIEACDGLNRCTRSTVVELPLNWALPEEPSTKTKTSSSN